jgi:hypothetical protein
VSLSRVKSWISGEVLTASDLNAEFNNVLTNAISLISPLTSTLDIDGNTLTLDAAAVTSVVSSASVAWNFTSGSKTGTPSTTGTIANWSALAYTDSATAGSGTATNYVGVAIQAPTLAASNTLVTTTHAATLYVAASPTASTNETITNGYAIWADAGITRLDGGVMAPIVQSSKSTAYTTVLSDSGKHILHPTADNNARTFTIDSNANVAYDVGTVITFINQINTVTIAITSDTMTLAGTSSTGSRSLAVNGIATAIKVASTSWIISGTGLT